MMNAHLFLEEFGHLVTSAEGVQKLRGLILELAVRGQLMPQNPNDEPAEMLLQRIEEAKRRLIEAGELKPQKPLPPIKDDEIPCDLPSSWVWVRLGEVTNYGQADKVESNDVVNISTWVLELEDIEKISSKLLRRTTMQEKDFKSTKNKFFMGDVLYGKLRPYLDKAIVADQDGVCTTEIIPFNGFGLVAPYYLRLLIKSPRFIEYASNSTHGMNLPRLSTDKAREAILALAPYEEQQRIVAKVDELMALCDQLEAELTYQSSLHQHATQSVLHHLTQAASPRDAYPYWQQTAEHFAELFDQTSTITELRAAILQLAVRGQLVPQDPNDEPASKLLLRIEDEKQRLIEAGELKPQKPLLPVTEDEIPYDLPSGWVWVRLGEITQSLQTGPFGSNLHQEEYISGGIPIVNPSNMVNGRILPEERWTVDQKTFDRLSNYALSEGDLVIARRGEMGRCAIVSENEVGWLCGTGSLILRTSHYIFRPYLWLFFQTEVARSYLIGGSVGATMDNLSQKVLLNMPFPLPSIATMQHIIAKVDELMAFCDQLEAEAEHSQALAASLLDSLVHHLFASN